MSQALTPLAGLLELADQDPDVPVVIDKRFGRWRPRTRGDLVAEVAALRASLQANGAGSGVTVLNAMPDRFEWLVVDLAVQAAGSRLCPVPSDAPDRLLADAIRLSGATIVMAPGQDFVDRLLTLEETGQIERVVRIVYQETAGLTEYDEPRLISLHELRSFGQDGEPMAELRAAVERLSPDDEAVIAISAGVEGDPRVSALTRGSLLAASRASIDAFGLGPKDRVLAYRPLSDPTERTTTIYPSMLSGALLALSETRVDVRAAMYEIAPTFVHLTSRLVDGVVTDVMVRLRASRGLKGLITKRWLASNRGDEPKAPGLLDRSLVTFPVLEKLGLDRARAVVVSGSELSPGVRRRMASLGLPIRTAFATSAVGGVVTLSEPGDVRPGACGAPLNAFGIDVTEDGELVIDGPGTASTIRTGDAARLVDGQLLLEGRLSERISLDDGGSVSLLEIESALRSSPYIREAVVARQDDGSTVAVVELAEGTTARWASEQDLAFVTYRSLVALPEVLDFARREVDEVLASTPLRSADEVRILPVRLESIDGALVSGEKLRRDVVIAAGLKEADETATRSSATAT